MYADPTRKPATIYPRTNGCFNFLNSNVVIPAEIRMSAKSAIRFGKCDIVFSD